MANTTPVLVRLSPDKIAFLDSEAARLGVPRATVIQLWITEKQIEKSNSRTTGKEKKMKNEPCRWATTQEQSRNQTTNRNITFQGESRCLSEWASILGISPATLHTRLKKWPLEKALTKKGGKSDEGL
jgi:hypothetical protein